MNESRSANSRSRWLVASRKTARKIVKVFLPVRVLREALRFWKYAPNEQARYLRIRLLNQLGLRQPRRPKALNGIRTVLFVCFGNIMRSPMCEALTKQELLRFPNVHLNVASAGLNATPENPAHPWSISTAPKFGISLENHRARLLTAEMVREADIIFAMDYQNEVDLICRYPQSAGKVYMLSAFSGNNNDSAEIRDPFYGNEEETTRCYHILQTCIHNFVSTIASRVS
jgi:protein-tyrosine-phosphatase